MATPYQQWKEELIEMQEFFCALCEAEEWDEAEALFAEIKLHLECQPPEEVDEDTEELERQLEELERHDEDWDGQRAMDALLARRYKWPAK
jgi:pentatricopeptide repeat protein